MSLFTPTYFADRVTDISMSFLDKINAKGIMLDIDDTLVPQNVFIPAIEVVNWVNSLKTNNLRVILVSNNHEKRVSDFAGHLSVPYVYLSSKPFVGGVKRALNMLELGKDQVIMVGDQIFTDILAANFMKIKSVLINPLSPSQSSLLKAKRLFEKSIRKRFINKPEYHISAIMCDNNKG